MLPKGTLGITYSFYIWTLRKEKLGYTQLSARIDAVRFPPCDDPISSLCQYYSMVSTMHTAYVSKLSKSTILANFMYTPIYIVFDRLLVICATSSVVTQWTKQRTITMVAIYHLIIASREAERIRTKSGNSKWPLSLMRHGRHEALIFTTLSIARSWYRLSVCIIARISLITLLIEG